jgi:hypothetical protein
MADDGKWPKALMLFLYDLKPAKWAPNNDGIVAPSFQQPGWIDQVARLPGALDVAQRARESAEGDAKTAEDKASRLVQIALALLTIALALGSYQLDFALRRSSGWLATVAPVGLAIAFLALSAFEALQVDRVGKYSLPDGSELESAQPQEVSSRLLAAEVRGRTLASWSARNKHSALMQARAWFTRGLAALLVAGLIAGVARATSEATSARNKITRPTTPSTRSVGSRAALSYAQDGLTGSPNAGLAMAVVASSRSFTALSGFALRHCSASEPTTAKRSGLVMRGRCCQALLIGCSVSQVGV